VRIVKKIVLFLMVEILFGLHVWNTIAHGCLRNIIIVVVLKIEIAVIYPKCKSVSEIVRIVVPKER
jgi:exopolysaccharide biosynthesis protein